METRVQKWGNSLALRIPKAFADQIGIEPDSAVDISLVDGELIISPVITPKIMLDELLADVTQENLHGEVDTGPSVGHESW